MRHEQLSQAAVLFGVGIPFSRSGGECVLETDHLLFEGLDVQLFPLPMCSCGDVSTLLI